MDWIAELEKMTPEQRKKLPWNDPRLDRVAEAVEKKYGLPNGAIRALKFAENTGLKDGKLSESKNDSTARSVVNGRPGAEGVMQFMPATRKLQNGLFEHNPLEPVESIDAAGRYFQFTLKNQYKGNVIAAIADYNGGPEQAKYVLKGKRPKAQETANYLDKAQMFFERMQPQQGGKK
jgi:soluble lytic murein transglycosylase-like protein